MCVGTLARTLFGLVAYAELVKSHSDDWMNGLVCVGVGGRGIVGGGREGAGSRVMGEAVVARW